MPPLAAGLSTWDKAPRSGVLSAWVLYSGKTPASGWFIGCFIEIKHPAVMAGVLLKVLGGSQVHCCRWAAMGIAAYRSRPGACDRHMRRLCSIRPRYSRALCARLCQARPCPPLAGSPVALPRSAPKRPRPGSGGASGCFIRAGVLFERVFYWGALCAGGG